MNIIVCSGCAKQVNLPDELIGGTASCPLCKALIQSTGKDAQGQVVGLRLVSRNPFAKSRSILPGFIILMLGLLAIYMNGVEVVRAQVDPEGYAEHIRNDFDKMKEQNQIDPISNLVKRPEVWLPRVRLVATALGVLSTVGGICMIIRRGYLMACIGCAAALINISTLCMIMGCVVGGWGLLVMLSRDVKDNFESRKKQPAAA